MKGLVYSLLTLLFLAVLTGCATGPIEVDASFLENNLAGKSFRSIGSNEAYFFLPDGRAIYIHGDSGTRRAGEYYAKETTLGNSVLCLSTGRTLDRGQETRCLQFFPGRTDDALGRDSLVVKHARCTDLDKPRVRCVDIDGYYYDYLIYDELALPGKDDRFVARDDFTVIDKKTSKQWMQCTLGEQSILNIPCLLNTHLKQAWSSPEALEEGISEINRDEFAGHNDWRLPTLAELAALMQCSRKKRSDDLCGYTSIPHIDPIFSAHAGDYLAAERGVAGQPAYGVVDFGDGYSGTIRYDYDPFSRRSASTEAGESEVYIRLVRDLE